MIGKLDNLAKGTFGMTVMEAQAFSYCVDRLTALRSAAQEKG